MNYLNLEEFEKKLGYHFADKHLLLLALTHSSYANENKKAVTKITKDWNF